MRDTNAVGEVGELGGVRVTGLDRDAHQLERVVLELGVVVGVLDEEPGGGCPVVADERASRPTVRGNDLADPRRPSRLCLVLIVHALPEGLIGVSQLQQLGSQRIVHAVLFSP